MNSPRSFPTGEHIDWTTLVEYHEGLLSVEGTARVQGHLASGCPWCCALHERLSSFEPEADAACESEVPLSLADLLEGEASYAEVPTEAAGLALGLLDQWQAGTLPAEPELRRSPVTALSDALAEQHNQEPTLRRLLHGSRRRLAAGVRFLAAPLPSTLGRLVRGYRRPDRDLARLNAALGLVERAERWSLLPTNFLAQIKLDLFLDLIRVLDALESHHEATTVREAAITLARSLRERALECRLHREVGSAWYHLSEYGRALGSYQRSLLLARSLQEPVEVYQNMRNMGCVHSRIGNATEAVNIFGEAIHMAREHKLVQHLSSDLHNLSIGYLKLGEFQRALAAVEEAMNLERDTGDRESLAFSLVSKSNILAEIGEHEEAITACKEALSLFTEWNAHKEIAMCLLNIGSSYNDLGQPEQAMPYFVQSHALKEQVGDTAGVVMNLIEIGRCLRESGQHSAALERHETAYALCTRMESDELRAHARYQLALDCFQLGQTVRATEEAEAAHRLFQSAVNDKFCLETCYLLAKLYSSRHDERAIRDIHRQGRAVAEKLAGRFADPVLGETRLGKAIPGYGFFTQDFPQCLHQLQQ